MISLAPQTRVFISVETIDFRTGLDGIAQICRAKFSEEPMSGAIFVFRSKKGTSIKLLSYDGQGYWLCMKRLSQGKFRWWPDRPMVSAKELGVLLFNGDYQSAKFQNEWRQLN